MADNLEEQVLAESDRQAQIGLLLFEAGEISHDLFVQTMQNVIQRCGPIQSEETGDRVKEAMASGAR